MPAAGHPGTAADGPAAARGSDWTTAAKNGLQQAISRFPG
jgi:hypothetical protein